MPDVYALINAVLVKLHNLQASWITSGALNSADRLPNLSTGKIWQGNANRPAEVDPPGVPSGGIIIWHGTIANIPAGWVICDGNNSTPNLLTRFVEGVATAATDPGAQGGATQKLLDEQEYADYWTTDGSAGNANYQDASTGAKPNKQFKDSSKAVHADDYMHYLKNTITDARPSYYDVAFIMKT